MSVVRNIVPSVSRLENWKPISEWDDDISGVPPYLEKDRQIILNARVELNWKELSFDRRLKKAKKLIEEDNSPAFAFREVKMSYDYNRAVQLGLKDTIDAYKERTSRVYEIDEKNKVVRIYHDRVGLIRRIHEETNKTVSSIKNLMQLHIMMKGMTYYTYKTWKKENMESKFDFDGDWSLVTVN